MVKKQSERIIRRLLIAWLLLLGGVLLTQARPFPGSTRLGYWLLVIVALGSPAVALLLLGLMGLRLREALHRLRVLRRAANWKRNALATSWLLHKPDRGDSPDYARAACACLISWSASYSQVFSFSCSQLAKLYSEYHFAKAVP